MADEHFDQFKNSKFLPLYMIIVDHKLWLQLRKIPRTIMTTMALWNWAHIIMFMTCSFPECARLKDLQPLFLILLFSFTNKTLKMGVKTNNKWTSLGAMSVTTHWTAGLLAAPLALYRANMSWSACWKQRRKWLFIAGKQACYSYLGSCGIFFATSLKPSEGKGIASI